MHSPEAISKLIAAIYDGVTEPLLWHKALRQFVNLSGGRFAFFAIIDSSTRTLPASSVVGPETSSLDDALILHRELTPIDPGLPYALSRPQGGVFRFSETSHALTGQPETWRDFIRHELGSGDYHSRFGAEREGISLVLALHTPADIPRLTPEQEHLHAIVFDHLQRATRLAYRAPDLRLAARPSLVVDSKGIILEANPPAEAILSASDGLKAAQGRLRTADHATDQSLQLLIQHTCQGYRNKRAEQFCIIRRPSGEPDYLLRMGPLPLPDLGMNAANYRCLIEILGSEEQQDLAQKQLRGLFGLTQREAEIAALLTTTFNDLRSIAAHLGISHETARVHARSIFSKIGVSSQVELVRVLGRLL